jgi:hypothetical protein
MVLLKNFNRPHIGVYVLLSGAICFLGATVIATSQVWLIHLISNEAIWGGNSIFIGLEVAVPPHLYLH